MRTSQECNFHFAIKIQAYVRTYGMYTKRTSQIPSLGYTALAQETNWKGEILWENQLNHVFVQRWCWVFRMNLRIKYICDRSNWTGQLVRTGFIGKEKNFVEYY